MAKKTYNPIFGKPQQISLPKVDLQYSTPKKPESEKAEPPKTKPVVPVFSRQTTKANHIVPANDRQRYREFTRQGYQQALQDNAGARFHAGLMEGLSPVSLGLESEALEGSKAFLAGNVAGTMGQFAIPYAGVAPKIGKALSNVPKYAQMGKVGQAVARGVGTDLAVGVPLNTLYGVSKEGLEGKELAKFIGLNTAIDLIAGGVLEVIGGVLLKSGKRVATKAEFDALPKAEQAEVLEEVSKREIVRRQLKQQDRTIETISEVPTKPEIYTKIEKEVKANVNKLLAGAKPELRKEVRDLIPSFVKGETSVDDFIQSVYDAAVSIPYAKAGDKELLAGVRAFLKKGIKVTDDLRQIPDFKDFRIANAGKIKFSPNGSYVDVLYEELADMYGNVFPRTITNPVDQLERIISVLDGNKAETIRLGDVLTESQIYDEVVYPVLDEVNDLLSLSKTRVKGTETVKGFPRYKLDTPVKPLNRPVRPRTPQGRATDEVVEQAIKATTTKNVVRKPLKKGEVDFPDLPVKKTNIKNEARNQGTYIEVGEKFEALSPEHQQSILVHENAHNLSNKHLFEDGKFQDILNNKAFGETKTTSDGRTYWEGIFGDVGATAVDETLTEAIAIYKRNPEWLLENHPKAHEYIKKNIMSKPFTTPRKPLNHPVQPRTPQSRATVPNKSIGADNARYGYKESDSEFITNTVMNSDRLTDAEKANINPDDFRHKVLSDKEVIETANQRLQVDFDGEMQSLKSKEEFSAEDLVTSFGIIGKHLDDARKSGDYSKVNEWLKVTQERSTNLGQGLRVHQLFSQTPEGILLKGQREINKVVKAFEKKYPNKIKDIADEAKQVDEVLKGKVDDVESAVKKIVKSKKTVEDIMNLYRSGKYTLDDLKRVLGKKYGLPSIEDADIAEFIKHMDEAQKFDMGSYEYRMHRSRAENILVNKLPKKMGDKFRGLLRISMLLNPKTLVTRNPLGNLVLQATEDLKDIPGVLIDKAISAKTGQRSTLFMPLAKAKASKQGFVKGVKELGLDFKNKVDTSPTRGKYEIPQGRLFKRDTLNALDNATRYILQLGDRPFYEASYAKRIVELEKLGIVGEQADEMAKLYALDRVFQNNSAVAKKVMEIREKFGLPGFLVVPFAQTPANIFDKLLDYSPVGLGKALAQMVDIKKGAKFGVQEQKLLVDRLARTFTGAGIVMLSYALAEKGLLTGANANSDYVEGTERYLGKQAYSLKIGDTYISYAWAEPIGSLVAAAVTAQQAGASKEEILEQIEAAGITGIDTVFQQSFLQGFFRLMSGYSPATGIAQAALGSTSMLTPTAGGQLARTIDKYERETYDPSMIKKQANILASRVPVVRQLLPKKLDPTGQPMKLNQGRNVVSRALEQSLFPHFTSKEVDDATVQEMYRVYNEVGGSDTLLKTAPKTIQADKQVYKLTQSEYIKFQETMGQYAYKEAKSLTSSARYKQMTDEQKAKALGKINDKAWEKAKEEFLRKRASMPVKK